MVSYFSQRMSQQLGGKSVTALRLTTCLSLTASMLDHLKEYDQLSLLTCFCVGREYAPGYEGFVELSREIMKGRNSKQQQQAVSGVLGSLMPPQAAERFRKWFPVSKVPLCRVTEVCIRQVPCGDPGIVLMTVYPCVLMVSE